MNKNMNKNSAYRILGIPTDSSEDIIKKAYKKLALQYHPDKNQSEEAKIKFQEISNAYNTLLSDNSTDSDVSFSSQVVTEIFEMFKKFQDEKIYTTIELTLQELYDGGVFNVEYTTSKHTGNIIHKQYNVGGVTFINEELETVNIKHFTDILIPPQYMTEEGPIIERIDKRTNLYVSVIEKNDPIFKRSGEDLISVISITLKEALTGFERNIMHLNGTELKINGTSIICPKTEKRIESSGYTESGYLVITFNVIFPDSLTEDTKKALYNMDI